MRVIGYRKVVELVFIDRYRRGKERRGKEQGTRAGQGRRQVVAWRRQKRKGYRRPK